MSDARGYEQGDRLPAAMDVAIQRLTLRVEAMPEGASTAPRLPSTEEQSALRQRAEQLLGAMELHPEGLPPSSVLILKRLSTPAPAGVAPWHDSSSLASSPSASSPARGSRGWERGMRSSLREQMQEAKRPDRGTLPTEADALLFRDRSELVATLSLQLTTGKTHDRWIWQALGRKELPTPVALLLESPRELPAVLEQLQRWDKVGSVLQALTDADIKRLLASLCRAYDLADLSQVLGLPVGQMLEPHAAPWSVALETGQRGSAQPELSARAAAEREAPVNAQGLGPARTALLGVGLELSRFPQRVRSRTFLPQLRRWWSGEGTSLGSTLGMAKPAASGASGRTASKGEPSSPWPIEPPPFNPTSHAPPTFSATARGGRSGARDATLLPFGPSPVVQSTSGRPNARAGENTGEGPFDPLAPVLMRGTQSLVKTEDSTSNPLDLEPLESADAFYERLLREQSRASDAEAALNPDEQAQDSWEESPETSREGGWDAASDQDSSRGREGRARQTSMHTAQALSTRGPQGAKTSNPLSGQRPQDLRELLRRLPLTENILAEGVRTGLGGIFFLVPVMLRLGLLDAPLVQARSPWWVVEHWARWLLGPLDATEDADPVWPALQALHGGETTLELESLLAPLTPATTWLMARLAEAVTRLRGPEAVPDVRRDLLAVSALLHVTRCHVDISIQMEDILMPVRLAGLDQDPGWQPLFGRVIQYHFTG